MFQLTTKCASHMRESDTLAFDESRGFYVITQMAKCGDYSLWPECRNRYYKAMYITNDLHDRM